MVSKFLLRVAGISERASCNVSEIPLEFQAPGSPEFRKWIWHPSGISRHLPILHHRLLFAGISRRCHQLGAVPLVAANRRVIQLLVVQALMGLGFVAF